ncbi:ribonuclease H-like domain-containing protein [Tanacetum coccineum]
MPRPTNVNVVRSMRFSGKSKMQDVFNLYAISLPGFVDTTHPDYVVISSIRLYGLKAKPLEHGFQRFTSIITRVGFQHSKTDASLFVFHRGSDIAYLLLYVDDIILTASSTALLQRIITVLHGEFAMTDLGSLNYFLGISAQRTPVDTESKLGSDGDPVSDPTLYRSLAGALQYLTFTRPDISYAVQQVCLYMHDPRAPHFTALKRILRYVPGCYLTTNPVQHQRTKHIEIDIHFVRDYVASGQVRVLHIPSRFQYADLLFY